MCLQVLCPWEMVKTRLKIRALITSKISPSLFRKESPPFEQSTITGKKYLLKLFLYRALKVNGIISHEDKEGLVEKLEWELIFFFFFLKERKIFELELYFLDFLYWLKQSFHWQLKKCSSSFKCMKRSFHAFLLFLLKGKKIFLSLKTKHY